MLAQFRLETFFATWEFKARFHLTASDAETLALPELLALAGEDDRKRWETLRLGYIDTRGTPELRAAIAQTYDSIDDDHVLCFAGAEEGLYCALRGLLTTGDHAIVLVPNYQSMESIPEAVCEVTGVSLDEERGWQLDVEQIRRALRPNTRMVAVNFPNNPTGAIASHAAFGELIELCAERGLYLFSDEVYRGVERDERKRLPQAADRYERALSLNVMSKAYGLPGLRIGWIASRDAEALDRMRDLKHYLSICNSAPSEILATIALNARATLLKRNAGIVAANVAKLDAFFGRHGDRFDWYDPDGGCVAFPRYRGPGSVEEFCRELLESQGVLLLPASYYESTLVPVPTDRFRIGFGRLGMDEALEAFESFLQTR